MNEKYAGIIWAVVLIVILSLAGVAYRSLVVIPPQPENQSGAVEKGSDSIDSRASAPAFTLTNRKGKSVSLESLRGKVVVLNFWASWCPSCRDELPEFERLGKELEKSGNAVFLALNIIDGQRETRASAEKFLKSGGYTFEVLFDDDGRVAMLYKVMSIPATFIIDKNGKIAKRIEGPTTADILLREVKALSGTAEANK